MVQVAPWSPLCTTWVPPPPLPLSLVDELLAVSEEDADPVSELDADPVSELEADPVSEEDADPVSEEDADPVSEPEPVSEALDELVSELMAVSLADTGAEVAGAFPAVVSDFEQALRVSTAAVITAMLAIVFDRGGRCMFHLPLRSATSV